MAIGKFRVEPSKVFCLAAFTIVFTQGKVYAEEDLSLNNLLEMVKVTIATKTERSLAQAPSSITVLTKDDIKRKMCRDLLDVINLVPGFAVARDLEWDSGLISRGIFAYEGRALIMIDGMQLNGLYFGNYLLGNELPIHMIERVEIIRGPGAVIYGGAAELAVINIISSNPKAEKSTTVFTRYGQLKVDPGHRDIGVQHDSGVSDDSKFRYKLSAIAADATASNSEFGFFDYVPKRESRRNQQRMRDHYSFLGLVSYGDTSLKLYSRQYSQDYQEKDYTEDDGYTEKQGSFDQQAQNALLEHQFVVSKNLSLNVSFDYQYSLEWKYINETVREIARSKPGLSLLYRSESLEILAGAEYFVDDARMVRSSNDPEDSSKGFYKSRSDTKLRNKVSVANQAVFFGATYFWDRYSAVAGVRYDANEIFGNATSPRMGVTANFRDSNVKLVYSEAFRAPLTGNNSYTAYGIDPSKPWRQDVVPETVKVLELELSHIFSREILATFNIFDQTINKVIEFYYDSQVNDSDGDGEPNGDLYSKNGGEIGTRGVEAELKYESQDLKATANYSFSELTQDTALSYIARHRKASMGVPDQKLHLNVSYRLREKFTMSLNQLYMGRTSTMSK